MSINDYSNNKSTPATVKEEPVVREELDNKYEEVLIEEANKLETDIVMSDNLKTLERSLTVTEEQVVVKEELGAKHEEDFIEIEVRNLTTRTTENPSMSFETERFITEVHNRPCLWNILSEENSNRLLKQSAWNEIADILYADWQNIEESTKRKRKQDLQKKWKGLRDYHSREKNKDSSLKSGSGTTKKRKTPYLDMLQFLNVSKASSQTSSNIRAETSGNIRAEISSNIMAETSSNIDAEINENDNMICSNNSDGNHSTPKQKKMTVFQEALLSSMDKRENDPDMNFLLNILPEMKTMTAKQNFEFRFEVMKVIKNIKYK